MHGQGLVDPGPSRRGSRPDRGAGVREFRVVQRAIADDDQKEPSFDSTRHYIVDPGQVFRANSAGQVEFQELSRGPAVLQQATDLTIEMQLLPAARR